MRHRQAALGHHLHQVSQTQLESKIPAHAQNDDFAVEVATLEQLLHALQLAHCRPSTSSAATISDRIAPFAPEPERTGPRWRQRSQQARLAQRELAKKWAVM